jgi:hypothetical protein
MADTGCLSGAFADGAAEPSTWRTFFLQILKKIRLESTMLIGFLAAWDGAAREDRTLGLSLTNTVVSA